MPREYGIDRRDQLSLECGCNPQVIADPCLQLASRLRLVMVAGGENPVGAHYGTQLVHLYKWRTALRRRFTADWRGDREERWIGERTDPPRAVPLLWSGRFTDSSTRSS